jgi:hypothetical protein
VAAERPKLVAFRDWLLEESQRSCAGNEESGSYLTIDVT